MKLVGRFALALGIASSVSLASCAPSTHSAGAHPAPRASVTSTPSVSATDTFAPPALRLPDDARPLRYDLDLWLDPESPTFRGRIAIDLDVKRTTRVVWLNATELGVDSGSFDVGGASHVARVILGGQDFVGLAWDAGVPVGRARLTLTFHGAIDRARSRGIYAAKEPGGESYLYTFFEPTDARRAFPAFDEPGYKVPWKVTLHVPNGDVALANAKIASETKEDDRTKAVAFEETKPISSYLVAFVVGPFDIVDAAPAGRANTPLRFVVPKGRRGDLAYAAEVTPKIVGLLEDYFGIPYPFGKLDVAVVPRFWGTMEHPGLVALGQPLALIAPGDRSLERERRYANIAIHELGHYWFGDYVTTAWWDDTWLNEALTEWIDGKISNELEPRWRFDLERIARAGYAMPVDALESAKKIRQAVTSKSDIASSFDGEITYLKGQSVFGMFEAWMTPAKTRQAVQAYLAAHAWKTATSDDLFAAFDAAQPGAGAGIRTFVDQPGLPLVTVTPSCAAGNGTLTIEQHRYRLSGSRTPDQTWKVPVCVRYGIAAAKTSNTTCTLLTEARAVVPLSACATWIEPNAGGLGYYHSAYSPASMADAFTHANDGEKLALLRDAAALVESGDAKLGDVLGRVADAATSPLAQITESGAELATVAREQVTPEQEPRLGRFLAKTFGTVARKLGLRRRPSDDAATLDNRVTALRFGGIRGRDPVLRAAAHEAAMAWLKDDHAIDPEMRAAVLVTAAKSNDASLFAGLLEKVKKETDQERLRELVLALGGFTAPELVARADALLTGGTLDLRDASSLLYTQLADHATRDAAWAFVRANFDALAARMRSDEVSFVIIDSLNFCDDAHRREIEALGPHVATIDGAPHALAKAVERIVRCVDSASANRASLDAFLAKY